MPIKKDHAHIDGLVQNRSNSIANTLELLQSFTKPSIYESSLGLTSIKTSNVIYHSHSFTAPLVA